MKSKSELMKKLRRERKEKGMVEVRLWCTPSEKSEVQKLIRRLRGE